MGKTIRLNQRFDASKSQLNQGRKNGRIPAVLYGIGKTTVSVEVNEKEVQDVLRTNPRSILQAVTPDEGVLPVIIRNIQRKTFTGKLVHIDFQLVNMNESMDSKVKILFSGESVGVKAGGVLQVDLYEVEVRCMPDHLPSCMEVDISGLFIGDQLLVSDLNFREGIEVLTDPNAVMIKINSLHGAAVDETA